MTTRAFVALGGQEPAAAQALVVRVRRQDEDGAEVDLGDAAKGKGLGLLEERRGADPARAGAHRQRSPTARSFWKTWAAAASSAWSGAGWRR